MDTLFAGHDAMCNFFIRCLLVAALRLEEWRRYVKKGAQRLRGSLRKLLDEYALRRVHRPHHVRGSRARNRTPEEIEEKVVALHVELPKLGAGMLRQLVYRVFAFEMARETVRKILLRNRDLIAVLEEKKRKAPRRIHIGVARKLWGIDTTLVWVLGFFPLWIVGVVDYCGSKVMALEPVMWPTAACVTSVIERAFEEHGVPERILSDRGTIFRAQLFEAALAMRGVRHTLTRPCHPYTNGRIERLFRTFKQTMRPLFWLVRSEEQWARLCADFITFHNDHRPHSSYGGRTPSEVYEGRAHRRSGTRGRITFFEGRLLWWRFT